MSINFKQSQFELFPGTTGPSIEAGKSRYLFANLTLSLENAIVAGILVMMFLVFSFALGIERGKTIGKAPLAAPVKKEVASVPVTTLATHPTKQLSAPVNTTAAKTQAIIPAATPLPVKNTLPAPVVVTPPAANSPLEQLRQKPYTIQVASFKKEEYAVKAAQDLKKKGHDTTVVGKGQHFIVCVGKFVSENEAKNFSGRLKKQYRDCLVRRL